MSPLEITMLVCFGASWPLSIAKIWRTKESAGKSPAFLMIIMLGYAAGIAHKLSFSRDWVLLLYVLNLCMVAIDLALYMHFLKRRKPDQSELLKISQAKPHDAEPLIHELSLRPTANQRLTSGTYPVEDSANETRHQDVVPRRRRRQKRI